MTSLLKIQFIMPLKIAVTGNMGSGKTTVCQIFEVLGVPVFYADKQAKSILNSHEVLPQLIEIFGTGIINSKGNIDRQKLASIVFTDREKLDQLNHIIHPKVYEKFDQWVKQQTLAPYCLMEAAIIFESGSQERFDKTILVSAPLEVMRDRVIERDHTSETEVMNRMKNQMPQEEKIKLADHHVINDGKT
ncbi:MAG: dephospho-CoA kinase, partial [Bacteroidota bacterium]